MAKPYTMASTIALAFSILAGASAVYGQGSWTTLAPLPASTEGLGIGKVGNTIVVAYGYLPLFGGDQNVARLYNINTDTWSLAAPGPAPNRSEIAYGDASHGGFVYVAGGRRFGVLADLDRYDVVTNTWTGLAPMPTARAAAAFTNANNSLYVIGGRRNTGGPCSGNAVAAVERYDVDTGVWNSLAPLPTPRSDLSAVTVGSKIYVFGGCTWGGGSAVDTVDIYNIVTNTWSSGALMPTRRASMVAASLGGKIYVIAGYTGGPPLAVNEVYNVATNTWSTDAPITVARGESNAIAHGGRIYVVGGALPGFGTSIASVEVFKK